jgi:hypothetical protein
MRKIIALSDMPTSTPKKKKIVALQKPLVCPPNFLGQKIACSRDRLKGWLAHPSEQVHEEPFQESMNWRIFRIMAEFVEGFDFLARYKKTVSFFGSTRASFADRGYQEAKKLAMMLGKEGFTIITGGGPGVMEAANYGASEVGAPSVGLNIALAADERRNQYVKEGIGFHHFFTRMVMLSAAAQAYLFFPGGFGTLDELFEIVTLIQTKKIPESVPVILVGKTFWMPLMKWIHDSIWDDHLFIDREEMKIMELVDSAEEAFEIIKQKKGHME